MKYACETPHTNVASEGLKQVEFLLWPNSGLSQVAKCVGRTQDSCIPKCQLVCMHNRSGPQRIPRQSPMVSFGVTMAAELKRPPHRRGVREGMQDVGVDLPLSAMLGLLVVGLSNLTDSGCLVIRTWDSQRKRS